MGNPVEILQSARKKKGMSQEILAKKVGISHRMIQRYEEGKWPKYKSDPIKKIDEILGTRLYEIIYDSKGRYLLPGSDKSELVPDVDSFLVSKMVKQDAMLETILEVLAEQEAARTSQPVTKLLSELTQTVVNNEARIMDELKQSDV